MHVGHAHGGRILAVHPEDGPTHFTLTLQPLQGSG
jgi:hypothetical protein